MDKYNVRYGYLHMVKFPEKFGTIPTFKEEKIKLSQEEIEFLTEQLNKFRETSK